MNKLKAIGRMVQWVVELSQFDIEYYPRIAIKAQALANFIVEFIIPDEEIQDELGGMDDPNRWVVNPKKRGSGVHHQHSRKRCPQVRSVTSIPHHQQ